MVIMEWKICNKPTNSFISVAFVCGVEDYDLTLVYIEDHICAIR